MEHPITPPPGLVAQWYLAAKAMPVNQWEPVFATKAARWGADQQLKLDAEQIAQAYQAGADQELEACCEWLDRRLFGRDEIAELRAARRPKPPSLKEQALLQLDTLNADLAMHGRGCDLSQIRRALEALPND